MCALGCSEPTAVLQGWQPYRAAVWHCGRSYRPDSRHSTLHITGRKKRRGRSIAEVAPLFAVRVHVIVSVLIYEATYKVAGPGIASTLSNEKPALDSAFSISENVYTEPLTCMTIISTANRAGNVGPVLLSSRKKLVKNNLPPGLSLDLVDNKRDSKSDGVSWCATAKRRISSN